MDQQVACGKQLTKNTKVSIQRALIRDSNAKKLKSQPKLVTAQFLSIENFNKPSKEKKNC